MDQAQHADPTAERANRLREMRVFEPARHAAALPGRARRPLWGDDGRMLIVAADHTARGVTGTGGRAGSMLSRDDLLGRLARALSVEGVDGVLASADILEDLAALGLLEGRLAMGPVNRGGLAGSTFEIDDRVTGYTAEEATRARLDAGKLLLRIDLGDDRTAAVVERTREQVDAYAAAGIPLILEPFLSASATGRLVNTLDAEACATVVGIASAIGGRSSGVWLKLPVVDEMHRVAEATTMPILLLGGDTPADPEPVYRRWAHALALPGVRGMVVGRSVLYPDDGDVERHVGTVADLIHHPKGITT